MRHIAMGLLVVVGSLTAATASEAASCSGNACAWLQMEADKCTIKNVGTGPVSVTIDDSDGTSKYPNFGPGVTTKLKRLGGGCVPVRDITHYEVNSLGSPPENSPTGEDIARKMGFAEPHPCLGPACHSVRLVMDNNCAWLKNIGSSEVKVTVHLATKSLEVVLPGVKVPSSKDAEAAAKARLAAAGQAAECAQARRAAEMLKQIHRTLSDAPGIAAKLKTCPPEGAGAAPTKAAAGSSKPTNGGYRTNIDFISQKRTQVYWAMPMTGNGCVKSLDQITDYMAE